jgi:hypothetical protein
MELKPLRLPRLSFETAQDRGRFPAGGPIDIVARMMALSCRKRSGGRWWSTTAAPTA